VETINRECNQKLYPHEISVVADNGKKTVLRQGDQTLEQLEIGTGTVLQFWNGKWEV